MSNEITYYCSFGTRCFITTKHCETGKFLNGMLSHDLDIRRVCRNYNNGMCHANNCDNLHLKLVCGTRNCRKHIEGECNYLHPEVDVSSLLFSSFDETNLREPNCDYFSCHCRMIDAFEEKPGMNIDTLVHQQTLRKWYLNCCCRCIAPVYKYLTTFNNTTTTYCFTDTPGVLMKKQTLH